MELVQSYDCFLCQNYIVMKDNDLNYFPCFEEKEKIFSFILCWFCFVVGLLFLLFFFSFLLEKKIQLYILSH